MPETGSGLPMPGSSPHDSKADHPGTLRQNQVSTGYHHPRATPQGTYLSCVGEDVEDLKRYKEGGYHPVHLDDCLGPANQYRVLHKLGYGGYGTVWLCRDTRQDRYVAVKVMVARNNDVRELPLLRLDQKVPGAEFVISPLHHFTLQGPNGSHLCLVLPLLGPPVSPDLWNQMRQDPDVALHQMARQAAQGLSYLHKNQICHGDFRAANILVRLINIDHLSEDELFSLIGQPDNIPVKCESGGDPPDSSPKYLIPTANITALTKSVYLADQITIIDFGESFDFSSPPSRLGIPRQYLPPEVLLSGGPPAPGPAADLWALGCTLFEIRQQKPLFAGKRNHIVSQMVRALGKPPAELWDKWEARNEFFDDEAKWTRDSSTFSIESCLEQRRSLCQPQPGTRGYLQTPDTERKLLADLLYQLLQYDPAKRLTAEQVLEHGWLAAKDRS
ncbi:hypothetical protein CEP54_008306 [Fusarium duplospermum]|uniref:EKC/KEOPS complex subunit BUD32 n=1 Tax=Fusarium duplospermum TaxID=1325734 RepID=A0A428PWL8_9HYPO|nr:hypothetical protein CEP54_008306 [Fusarium duplospermum]